MESLSTLYTVVPIEEPYKQKLLQKYVEDTTHLKKASLCRFYLRGTCLLKQYFCKYGHGIDDLIDYELEVLENAVRSNDRQPNLKRPRFSNDSFFNQKALFAHEPTTYYVLYDFQNKHKLGEKELMEIDDSFDYRNNLRTALHEHNWRLFMYWLTKRFPYGNLVKYWVEYLYKVKGFVKQHTHCKFAGLETWLMKSGRYFRYDILLPPFAYQKTTFIIDMEYARPLDTLLRYSNHSFAKKMIWMCGSKREELQKYVKDQLYNSYLNNKLPNQKTSLCKFFMKGNCVFSEYNCKFCHSFKTLQYKPLGYLITNDSWFEQKPILIEKNLGYPSLHEFQKEKNLSMAEIKSNQYARHALRNQLMKELYVYFLYWLAKSTGSHHFLEKDVKVEFHNVGLEKCASNRFSQLVQQLYYIGYCEGSYPESEGSNKKRNFIFKVPPIEYLDEYFRRRLHEVIRIMIKTESVLTEVDIRKMIYELQEPFTIPLHLYLKKKGLTVNQWMRSNIKVEEYPEVYFDLSDHLLRIRQQIIQHLGSLGGKLLYLTYAEKDVRKNCYASSLHCLRSIGLRKFIIDQMIQAGNRVYLLSVGSYGLIVPTKRKNKKMSIEQCRCGIKPKDVNFPYASPEIVNIYSYKRIVMVDSEYTLLYGSSMLKHIDKCGVDLYGNLNRNGYVYLVQVGFKHPFSKKNQILIFDIFGLKSTELYYLCLSILSWLFSQNQIMKIMHDCKQDSIAIHFLLRSCLNSVLDTCGTDLYLRQKYLYKDKCTSAQLAEVLQKVPGLNAILEKYGSPNGVNQLKEKMRLKFEQPEHVKAVYFEKRPIDGEFMEYAARDVEDLVDVAHAMLKNYENQEIAFEIGRLYASSGLYYEI